MIVGNNTVIINFKEMRLCH